MPQGATLRVHGYRDFLRACDRAGKESKREVRSTFRTVGRAVQVGASLRIGELSPRSAAGYRVRVRQRGIAVEQSLRRTTGRRGDWGATQMRKGLVPALTANEAATTRAFEQALDRVADHFEGAPL